MSATHEMLIRYTVRGNHTHLLVYCRQIPPVGLGTRANAGTLIMRNEEFEAWRDGTMKIHFANALTEKP